MRRLDFDDMDNFFGRRRRKKKTLNAEIIRLKNAMSGIGTDEKTINDIIAKLDVAERQQLSVMWDANKAQHNNKRLVDWIKDEFSVADRQRIIDAFYPPIGGGSSSTNTTTNGGGTSSTSDVVLDNTDVVATRNRLRTAQPILPTPIAPTIAPAKIDAPSFADVLNTSSSNKDDKRKKTMMFVGIGLGVLALGAVAVVLMRKKK